MCAISCTINFMIEHIPKYIKVVVVVVNPWLISDDAKPFRIR